MSLNILVADDERVIVSAVSRLLKRAGHHVVTATTADEALELLGRRGPFDVALVDHNMPGGGRTVLNALREQPGFEGRLFLMSGSPAEDVGALPPGTRHLQKPFNFPELVAMVEGD